jgi:hypothetical protein
MSDTVNPERQILGKIFDTIVRSLHGIPDVTSTKASTLRTVTPILELAQTWIVQTYRHRERGDTILIEYIGAEGSIRLALPADVANCIARQRDALTAKSRSRAAREEGQEREQAAGGTSRCLTPWTVPARAATRLPGGSARTTRGKTSSPARSGSPPGKNRPGLSRRLPYLPRPRHSSTPRPRPTSRLRAGRPRAEGLA